jgi:hypothetical protein
MIPIRSATAVSFAAAIAAFGGIGVVMNAQVPEGVAARHVRTAPIQVARRVNPPVMDRVGAFSPLPRRSAGAEVFGIVQDTAGVLVPNAGMVVVRELLAGTVAATTAVNDVAQFSLRSIPPGLYTAELVSPSGAFIASTAAFSAGVGEIIQISQTIPRVPRTGFARTVSSMTSAALSMAAGAGVRAVAPGAPVTPGS